MDLSGHNHPGCLPCPETGRDLAHYMSSIALSSAKPSQFMKQHGADKEYIPPALARLYIKPHVNFND
jgi:hypothetical protein